MEVGKLVGLSGSAFALAVQLLEALVFLFVPHCVFVKAQVVELGWPMYVVISRAISPCDCFLCVVIPIPAQTEMHAFLLFQYVLHVLQ